MTMTLELPPDVEQRLQEEAARAGVGEDEMLIRLVRSALPPDEKRREVEMPEQVVVDLLRSALRPLPERNRRAMELLDQWEQEGDEEEQIHTLEALKAGLNASHSSDRLIYP